MVSVDCRKMAWRVPAHQSWSRRVTRLGGAVNVVDVYVKRDKGNCYYLLLLRVVL